ncbi:MAG: PaaI family thioesterase [Candidatus Obscuribacterales bacterium]|nr:PaaI family thioesterase [Candidatus Obscuribacterales bacterium]
MTNETTKTNRSFPAMLHDLGGKIDEVRDGYARGHLPLSHQVMQPSQVYHAGAIVILADEVASAAIVGTIGSPVSAEKKLFPYSIQISTNLLTNDPEGPITAESKVVKKGRIVVVDTEVLGSKGQLVALVRSTHAMVDPRTTGPHKREIFTGNK